MAEPDALSLSGSARVRYETIDNQARPGLARSEDLISFRTILTGEYRRGNLSITGELRDARAYDARPASAISVNEVNALELVQAKLALDVPLANGAGARLGAGRFPLGLGSRRLVADDDYRNTTNGFTGVIGEYEAPGGVSASLFYVLPRSRLPEDDASVRDNDVRDDPESFDLRFWGGTAARPIGKRIAFDAALYRLDERDGRRRATRDRRLTTISARLLAEPKPGMLDGEIELIGQTGTISASAVAGAIQLGVRAWSAHAEIGYGFAARWKPRVSVEYDHASGDGRGGRYGRFDALFGSRRGDLAPSGIYNAVGRANIASPGVRLELGPSKRLAAHIAYRELWLASRSDGFSTTGVRDPAGRSGRNAGRQIDARVRWWAIPRRLQFEASGVLLDKGRFLRTAPNAPVGGDTRYVSLNAMVQF